MTVLVLLLVVLVLRLGAARSTANVGLQPSAKRSWGIAALAVLAALAPALRDVVALAGPETVLASDTASHLAIAQDVAASGLPHGWLPTYNGGFPIALHYPCVGWLITAGLLRIGVHPVVAVRGLGFVALMAVPLLVFVTARLAGARALAAATGAICVAWVTPYIQFSGGWESFFIVGLLSQVLVVPVVVGWAAALLRAPRWDPAPLAAALCAATHPQVFTATAFVFAVAALATGRRAIVTRVVLSTIGGGLVAIALYGPGIASMIAPFGWPPNLNWRLVGFGPSRVIEWIVDGDLLDYKHGAFVTSAWIAACLVHLLQLRRAVSRAVLAASVTTLVLCMWGPAIASAGALGRVVLSVFQPMRALVLVPLVATAAIVTAIDVLSEWAAVATTAIRVPRLRALAPGLLPLGLAAVAVVELPERFEALHAIAQAQSRRGADRCTPPIAGFDASLVQRWVADAPDGRVAFDTDQLAACASMHGAELHRRTPMAGTAGAGAHVGVHAVAFSRIAPDRPHSAARAEALGIRTLVSVASRRPGPPEEWTVIDRSGELVQSRRVGGTDTVGVGCIRGVLRGSEGEITAELFRILSDKNTSTFLDDPRTLLALEATPTSGLTLVPVSSECNTSSATIVEVPREPGAYEAHVRTEAPVDVVFRATAYSGWRVRDGDVHLPIRRVAPGFFAVHVGPGQHHLEAVVRLPRWYVPVVTFALLGAVALGVRRDGAARRTRRWVVAAVRKLSSRLRGR